MNDPKAERLRARMRARHQEEEWDDAPPGVPWHTQVASAVMYGALLLALLGVAWAIAQRPEPPAGPTPLPTAAVLPRPAYNGPVAPPAPFSGTEAQPAPQSTPLPTALVWTIPADGVLVQPDGSVVGAKPDAAPAGTAVPVVIEVQAAPVVVKLPSVGKEEPTAVKLPRVGKETRP